MRDVCIALLPALIASVYFFGFRALTVVLVSVAACVFFEWGYRKIMKLDCTIGDGSAVVTGLLLAFVCPVTMPYWAIIVGDFIAIIVTKQLFGGIGKNFVNPALVGRAFLFSWAVLMTTWVKSGTYVAVFSNFRDVSVLDGMTAATPLAAMKTGALPETTVLNSFVGNIGGCIGEASGAAACWAARTCCAAGHHTAHPPVLYRNGCGADLPVPTGQRPPHLDGLPGVLRRPDAGRNLYGDGLRHVTGHALGTGHLRHRLRRADGV